MPPSALCFIDSDNLFRCLFGQASLKFSDSANFQFPIRTFILYILRNFKKFVAKKDEVRYNV